LSFNELKQKKISIKPFEGTKMNLVEKLLQDHFEYDKKSSRGYVDFHLGNFITKNEGDKNFHFATLGKYKPVEIKKFNKDEKEHYKESSISSPWVSFLIDRKEQVFIIEKNSSVFSKYEPLFNSIEDHLNNLLQEYDISVSIAPVSSPSNFWTYISEYDYVYSVNFELFMPNLFGNTDGAAKEFLSDAKEKYNADSVSEQISNKDGALDLDPKDKGINKWLNWIGKGGGKWNIGCKKGPNAQREHIGSVKRAQTFSTSTNINDIEDKEKVSTLISLIISELKKYYLTQHPTEDENENN
jgi:hypothetical protein